MREALILARAKDVDVFNALDIMDNQSFLSELKFGQGDGHLQVSHRSLKHRWKVPLTSALWHVAVLRLQLEMPRDEDLGRGASSTLSRPEEACYPRPLDGVSAGCGF